MNEIPAGWEVVNEPQKQVETVSEIPKGWEVIPEQQPESKFSWLKAIPEYAAKGVGNVADFIHEMGMNEPMMEGRAPFVRKPGGGFERGEMPTAMPSEAVPEPTQIPETSLQRIGTTAIQAGTAGALGGLGGPGSAVRNVMMGAGLGTGVGGLSQGLQETGMSPGASEAIAVGLPIAAMLAPSAARGVKALTPSAIGERRAAKTLEDAVGRENVRDVVRRIEESQGLPYNPTTAEIAESPGISQIHEAYRGQPKHPALPEGIAERGAAQQKALEESIEGLRGGENLHPQTAKDYFLQGYERRVAEEEGARAAASSRAQQTLEAYEPRLTPEEAGHEMGQAIRAEDVERAARRTENVGPEYTQLRGIEGEFLPGGTLLHMENEARHHSPNSSIRRAIEGARDLIGTEPKSISMLEGDLQELTDRISSAERSGDNKKAFTLRRIKDRLYHELSEAHPQVRTARAGWAEASTEVNQLRNHPTFSKMLKTTDFDAHNLIPDSAIPKKVINSAEGSASVARDFLKIFGNNKKAMDSMRGYLNHRVVTEIMDANGQISIANINKFRKNNPGAFTLYPELETKLKNTSNATAYLNGLAKKSFTKNNDHYMDVFKRISGDSAEKMVPSIFRSKNSVEKVKTLKQELMTDKSGEAMQGFTNGVVDYVLEEAKSPAKFLKFYKNNKKNLAEVFNPDQMKILDNVEAYYKRQSESKRLSQIYQGSPTTSKKAILGATEGEKGLGGKVIDHMLHPVTGAIAAGPTGAIAFSIAGHYKGLGANAFRESLQRALLSPEYTKYLLEMRMNKQSADRAKNSISKWRKAYILGYPVVVNHKEEE